ncbi:MAG: C4-dicarboxylate transporter, DctQ subunit [Clostridiales bacterium]|nr:C4-dicarboxylate transporter, DctQ subunit [Clostridiales bacterium]
MKEKGKRFKILINLDIIIASIALVILVGCTFIGVIMRYVVGNPFGWIEEIQAFLIVWVVFLAGGAAYRTGNHASIEVLYELFPASIQKIVRMFIGLVVTAAIGYLCYTSIQYVRLFMQTGRGTAVLQIPFVYIYSVVPVSCFLQIFNYFLVNVFGYEDEVEKLVEDNEE